MVYQPPKRNDDNVVDVFIRNHPFKPKWILEGADEEMIAFAESAARILKDCGLSTSQIRNVFGEIKRIQLKGISDPEGYTAFMLLKPKVAYAYGRQQGSQSMGLKLFKKYFDDSWSYVQKDDVKFDNFCKFIEALVAYHKAFGGK